jgi:hypothetical protein
MPTDTVLVSAKPEALSTSLRLTRIVAGPSGAVTRRVFPALSVSSTRATDQEPDDVPAGTVTAIVQLIQVTSYTSSSPQVIRPPSARTANGELSRRPPGPARTSLPFQKPASSVTLML